MRVLRYTRALSRWIKAGRPIRSEEEIRSIFQEHCRLCEERDAQRNVCRSCGCYIGLEAAPLRNKLAMATEDCPKGKWNLSTDLYDSQNQ